MFPKYEEERKHFDEMMCDFEAEISKSIPPPTPGKQAVQEEVSKCQVSWIGFIQTI